MDYGPPIGMVYVHSQEDLILYELMYFGFRQQSKHSRDIAAILKSKKDALDLGYIARWKEILDNNSWDPARSRLQAWALDKFKSCRQWLSERFLFCFQCMWYVYHDRDAITTPVKVYPQITRVYAYCVVAARTTLELSTSTVNNCVLSSWLQHFLQHLQIP